ncbi:DNA repair protein rhp26 [Colletotrichum musicola]|uniref:DNA repair protein rhp26 n=1 Tax=Colletotrichum musicola TaxID=2175873 RepID=A0A8H6NZJ3_9PEZI|nr:DNA repair protein rhp26 [Colletotrichum musicola]
MAPEAEENIQSNGVAGDAGKTPEEGASEQKSLTSQPDAEADEESILRNITADIRDQDDLERDISAQANAALKEADDKRDQQRIEKLETTKQSLQAQRVKEQKNLERERRNPYKSRNIQKQIDKLDADIERVENDIYDFQARIQKRREEAAAVAADESSKSKSKKLPGESNREYLVRTGKITPFANVGGERPPGFDGELADALVEAEEDAAERNLRSDEEEPKSHQILRMPGFAEESDEPEAPASTVVESEFSLRPRKKRKVQRDASSDEFEPQDAASPESQYASDTSEEEATGRKRRKGASKKKTAKSAAAEGNVVDLTGVDDGNESKYRARLADWVKRRSRARRRRAEADGIELVEDDEEEWFKPSPDHPDHFFSDGLKLPGDIHPSLFAYQKTGVHWLAELYEQGVGGIIGDEMGLGKTVQAIAFIAALHYSKKLDKPVIVVVPATVMKQWVNEFHRWWPPLRVSILHSSGSGMMNQHEDDSDDDAPLEEGRNRAAARKIVKRVVKSGHVLVTTYAGLQSYDQELLSQEWGYAILDEGHKIRNPNADITVACKNLNTVHRLILSGTPIQNNLTELWSLFDFIFPMRLGNLVSFRTQFELPIKQGGYANATNLQVLTAEKCATTLKETISQYLLQRLKIDVASDLPEKTEQVLFCKLTPTQLAAYERFLRSDDVAQIMTKKRKALYGIDVLRKICNHPDLLDERLKKNPEYNWGEPSKSGKMQMVSELLPLWKRFGHKTLLFSQTKLMLNILEKFIRGMDGVSYVRMDGDTPIEQRQVLIDRFNNDPGIDVFLLTTRTGGLGINLTGATRIIIYDPDWNPSTDMQARERAWRLGQTKPVSIYRLMTSGSIEEKIYHRQIFKQFMTNKVLKDPKQRANFDLSDLYDLFSFGDAGQMASAERSKLFEGAEVTFNNPEPQRRGDKPSKDAVPISSVGGRKEGDDEVATVRQLSGVVSMVEYKEDKEVHDEKRMTENLFARNVESAYEHDQIMNGKKTVQADQAMNQIEANRVAAQAAALLRRSGQEARSIPIGTVTWTGEVGEGGRPGNHRRRAGPSSSGVMAGLANRQNLSGASSRSGTPSAAKENLRERDFVLLIHAFIKRQGGQVPSKMLVDHFNPYCQTARQSQEFKAALDKVADLSKRGTGSTGRGVWTLRPGFKG